MKKFFAIAAALLIGVAAFAQETNRDANGKIKFGGYETNKLSDNVFVGGGVGVNSNFNWANDGKVPFVTKGGFAAEAYVGKWFTPGLGTRLGWYGLNHGAPGTAQNVAAVDLLWNFSNSVFGYSEVRKLNWVPYLRAGLDIYGDDNEWVLGFGSMVTYALSDRLNLVLDNPVLVAKNSVYNVGLKDEDDMNKFEDKASRFSFPWAVTLGLSYNFGKTNWTRVSTTAAAAAAALAAAQKAAADKVANANKAAADAADAAKKAQNEANQLKNELANAGTDYSDLFDEPVVVYFEIGKSKLTAAEKAHAEYAIKNIINRGENIKFTLGGSADTKTGTARRNKQLSEQRAQTVYNLIDELGVSRDNITVVEWDGKTQRFATNELNRAVIIEKQ